MNRLKLYLNINATFSMISGLSMLILSSQYLSIFALNNAYVFPIVGANLVVFAAFVYLVSQKYTGNKYLVYLISALDGLWVIGSLVILIFTPFGISQQGYLILAAVAIWIGYLGLMQIRNFTE